MAGDENPCRVGDASSDQIGNEVFQKSNIVRDATHSTENLARLGRHRTWQKAVPDRSARLWVDCCESFLRGDGGKCREPSHTLRRTVGAVEHDDGWSCAGSPRAFQHVASRLTIDGDLNSLARMAGAHCSTQ